MVNGNIDINDAASALAYTDLLTAYNSAKALPPGTTISAGADLGALYPTGIAPGTYTSGSTMLVSTPLMLDAGGNANAVWVFQIGSSLTTNASVSLANGAQAKNVFWVPTRASPGHRLVCRRQCRPDQVQDRQPQDHQQPAGRWLHQHLHRR